MPFIGIVPSTTPEWVEVFERPEVKFRTARGFDIGPGERRRIVERIIAINIGLYWIEDFY